MAVHITTDSPFVPDPNASTEATGSSQQLNFNLPPSVSISGTGVALVR